MNAKFKCKRFFSTPILLGFRGIDFMCFTENPFGRILNRCVSWIKASSSSSLSSLHMFLALWSRHLITPFFNFWTSLISLPFWIRHFEYTILVYIPFSLTFSLWAIFSYHKFDVIIHPAIRKKVYGHSYTSKFANRLSKDIDKNLQTEINSLKDDEKEYARQLPKVVRKLKKLGENAKNNWKKEKLLISLITKIEYPRLLSTLDNYYNNSFFQTTHKLLS